MRLWYDKQSVNPKHREKYCSCSEELGFGPFAKQARNGGFHGLSILAELIKGLFSLNNYNSRSSEKWKRNVNWSKLHSLITALPKEPLFILYKNVLHWRQDDSSNHSRVFSLSTQSTRGLSSINTHHSELVSVFNSVDIEDKA